MRHHRLSLVRGLLNDKRPTYFVVDTGGEVISISTTTAEELDHDIPRKIALRVYGTSGWDRDAFLMPGVNLKFNDINYKNFAVVVLNLQAPSVLLGFQVGGIVGHKFLSPYRVSLDLDRSELRMSKAGTERASGDVRAWDYNSRVVPTPKAKRWQDSASETVQVVLPNDSNPLGFILGGTVMHLIDITGAIACHRHTNMLALTAGVDSLDFIHPIKVGDLIILKSRVTCVFKTSLEVEVEVFSEAIQTGERKLTSKAYLTFVSLDKNGKPTAVPPLLIETPRMSSAAATRQARRAERLKRKAGA